MMHVTYYSAIILLVFICPNHTKKPTEGSCGRPLGPVYHKGRIVGGYDLGYYKYPWFAVLMREKTVECGGALIGPKTVLTAAHCFKDILNSSNVNLKDYFTVKLGIYNNCLSENTQTEFKVEKVKIHENFPKKDPYFDIAVLILIGDTNKYQPICLPAKEINPRPEEGVAPGLGRLKYGGAVPCTVREARLLIYPDKECAKMIKETGNNEKEIKHAFCAGYLSGGIDTCQGDSGGPLQIIGDDGSYVLLGVVSFGFECARPNVLGVYTDVSHYLDWIQQNTGIDSNSTSDQVHNNSSENSTLKPNNHTKPEKPSQPPAHHVSTTIISYPPSGPFQPYQPYDPIEPPIYHPYHHHRPGIIIIFNKKNKAAKRKMNIDKKHNKNEDSKEHNKKHHNSH